jgi:crotonobetainyl-CoA:carnitine CoA-transferase CaiB-like acyl-CoA transferase
MGSAHPLNAPYQAFRTADGWVNIGAANQKNWERLVEILGRPELGSDPRFVTNDRRMANRPALEAALNKVFETKATDAWLAILEEGGFPAGPVLSIGEMHEDPQALAREMIVATDHPVAGRVNTLGLPVKFSATPGGIARPAPVLGQHSREVLAELGFCEREIARMIDAGAVIAAQLPAHT